jgi:hypothetical protein
MPIIKTAVITPVNICGANNPTCQWTFNNQVQSSTTILTATQPGNYVATINCPGGPSLCADTVTYRVECNNTVTIPISDFSLASFRYTNDLGQSVVVTGNMFSFSFPYTLNSWPSINAFITHFNTWNGANTISAVWEGPPDNRSVVFAFTSGFRFSRFSTTSTNYTVNGPLCNSDVLEAEITGGLANCNFNVNYSNLTLSPITLSTGYSLQYNRVVTSSTNCTVPVAGIQTSLNPLEKRLWVGLHFSYTHPDFAGRDYMKTIVLSSAQPYQRYLGVTGDLVVNQTILLWQGEAGVATPLFTTAANGVNNIPGGNSQLKWSTSSNGAAYAAALQQQIRNAMRVVFNVQDESNVRVIFTSRTDSTVSDGVRSNFIFIEFAAKHLPSNQEQWFGFRRPPATFFLNSNFLEGATGATTITAKYFHVQQDTITVSLEPNVCTNLATTVTSQIQFRVNPGSNATSFNNVVYLPFTTSTAIPSPNFNCNSGQLTVNVLNPQTCVSNPLISWFAGTFNTFVANSTSVILSQSGTYIARVICPSSGIFTTVSRTV